MRYAVLKTDVRQLPGNLIDAPPRFMVGQVDSMRSFESRKQALREAARLNRKAIRRASRAGKDLKSWFVACELAQPEFATRTEWNSLAERFELITANTCELTLINPTEAERELFGKPTRELLST